jgi:CxxC-x17-CxxC domain-containing protein
MERDPAKDVIYFAKTNFRNADRLFGVKRNDRRQHTYVVGKTGTGKSALLHNMIVQDIANGEGVAVVDPHGELVEGILEKIPEERMKDVIYFNPADIEYHIGFNILELPDPRYKHLVASGLMGIFTKIWSNVWSARMEYILNNAILALLETPGSTLLGIPRILVDKTYRQKVIMNVTDPVVKAFWINEYEQWQEKFRNEAIAPIQNKVGQFLSAALIRNVVGQSKSTVDIFDVMNSGKIFLVNVSKGRIGEDNSALLGAMLITKIQLAAMERVRIPEDERVDFYLYVDEFQNFATDSFAGILSEARKYRLNLIIAHQYIGQLVTGGSGTTGTSTKVRDAVFGNVGTMLVFRVGAADAEFLESEFEPEFVIQDIVNLPNHHIYLKLMVDGVTCRPFSATTLPPFKVPVAEMTPERIIQESRERYGRRREDVEKEINSWSGIMPSNDGDESSEEVSSPGAKFPAICTACGKKITLPFEPDPSRPVYCKSCFDKVKKGEMPPAQVTPGPSSRAPAQEERHVKPKETRQYAGDLAALGIEFEVRKEKPQHFGPKSSIVSGSMEEDSNGQGQMSAPEKKFSLTDLKPIEKKPKERATKQDVDINELRNAIQQSLGKKGE